jgi:hypothetical protein
MAPIRSIFDGRDRISLASLEQDLAHRCDFARFCAEEVIVTYIRRCATEADPPLAWWYQAGLFRRVTLAKALGLMTQRDPKAVNEMFPYTIFDRLRAHLFFDRQGVEDFYGSLELSVVGSGNGSAEETTRVEGAGAARRARNAPSYDKPDAPLLTEIGELLKSGAQPHLNAACEDVAPRAAGFGTLESKAARLARKFRQRPSTTANDNEERTT